MIKQVRYFYVLHKCFRIANANIKVMKINYAERNFSKTSTCQLQHREISLFATDEQMGIKAMRTEKQMR